MVNLSNGQTYACPWKIFEIQKSFTRNGDKNGRHVKPSQIMYKEGELARYVRSLTYITYISESLTITSSHLLLLYSHVLEPNATNSINVLHYTVPSIIAPPRIQGVLGVGCISYPTLNVKNIRNLLLHMY